MDMSYIVYKLYAKAAEYCSWILNPTLLALALSAYFIIKKLYQIDVVKSHLYKNDYDLTTA